MKKILLLLNLLSLLMSASLAHASAFATYDSPADLTQLPHTQIAGSFWSYFPTYHYHGGSFLGGSYPVSGSARDSRAAEYFPGLFTAGAINSTHQWFYGFGITRPIRLNDDERYPADNVGRYNSTREAYQTNTVVGALATKVTQDVSLGAALNINFLKVHYGAARMTSFPIATPDAYTDNVGNGMGASLTVNANYLHRDTGSYLSLLYRTPSAVRTNGTSTLSMPNGTEYTGHDFTMTAPLPAEFELKAVQYLTPKTYGAFIYHYTWWNSVNQLLFKNMRINPADPTQNNNLLLNFNWKNIDSYTLAIHQELTSKWAIQPSFTRTNTKESTGSYYNIAGLNTTYQLTPSFQVGLTYLHAFQQLTKPSAVSSSLSFDEAGKQTANYVGIDMVYDL